MIIDILIGLGCLALYCAPFIWYEYKHGSDDQ